MKLPRFQAFFMLLGAILGQSYNSVDIERGKDV